MSPPMSEDRDSAAITEALDAIPGIPRDPGGPVFGVPWQAQAFAMVLSLTDQGAFTWAEWSEALGAVIADAQRYGDHDTGETYYLHWLGALERIVADKKLATRSDLTRYHDAWAVATARTPHGSPIELRPGDFTETDAGRR